MRPRSWYWLSGATVGCLLLAVLAVPLVDDDITLHLGIGKQLLASGSIPAADCFSYTGQGRAWNPHYWLFSIGLYVSYAHLGSAGLRLVQLALWSGLIMLAVNCLPRPQRGWPYLLVLMLGLAAAPPLWRLRSHLVFEIGILLTVMLARPRVLSWRRWLALAVFFLLWAQIHASFLVGIALFFLWRLPSWRDNWRREAQQLLALFLLTGCNPHGAKLWLWPLLLLEGGKNAFIAEWGNVLTVPWWPTLALLIIFGVVVTVHIVIAVGRGARPWREIVLWTGFIAWTLGNRRMIAPAVISGLIAVAACAPQCSWLGRRGVGGGAVALLLAVTMTVILGPLQVAGGHPLLPPLLIDSLNAVKQVTVPGQHWFHPYAWGGLILLDGYPAVTVFIDGRTEVYPPEVLADYGQLYYAAPAWPALLKKYNITGIWLPPDAPLVGALAGDDWRLVYRGAAAVVMIVPAAE